MKKREVNQPSPRGCRCLVPGSQTQTPEDWKQLFSVFVRAGLSRKMLAQKEEA